MTRLPRGGAHEPRAEGVSSGSGSSGGSPDTGSPDTISPDTISPDTISPSIQAPPLSEPAPSTRRSRRTLLWTSSAYFGEGLPWSVLHQMATEYLTAIGASKTQVSSTSLLHLAVTFKFAWSPLVDLFGTRRRWLLVTQVLLGLGMLGAGAVVGSGNMFAFWCVLGVISVVHATHDVACDGFYLQALDPRSQALFSGTRAAAYRVALLVGSSLLVYLAGRTSWSLAFCTAGGLMWLVAVLNASVLPRGEARAHSARSRSAKFLTAYRSFFEQPQAVTVLTFMFFYRLGDIMMMAMSKPLLRDIGIDTPERGILNGVGVLAFIAGSIGGGALIARRGLERCLVPLTYVQNFAIPLYVGIAVLKPTFTGVLPIVMLEQLASGLGASASAVFLMQRTKREFSASHFAFATAIVSLASTLSGFLSGPLDEALGHVAFFSLAFVASWPSLLLVLFVPSKPVRGA